MARLLPDVAITRIPNPCDDPIEVEAWTKHRSQLEDSSVLVIGTLKEAKGQAALLHRLPDLVRLVPKIRLHFVGQGPQELELKRIAREVGGEDRVIFHGQLGRAQLYRVIRACQIVAIPSLWPEPFGRVPLEAAVAERPVVAFAVGGLGETIVDGVTGLLIPAGDFDAFNGAIAALANDSSLAGELASRAKQKTLAENDASKIAQKLFSIWREEISVYDTNTGTHRHA